MSNILDLVSSYIRIGSWLFYNKVGGQKYPPTILTGDKYEKI